jgi:hypothetical protein
MNKSPATEKLAAPKLVTLFSIILCYVLLIPVILYILRYLKLFISSGIAMDINYSGTALEFFINVYFDAFCTILRYNFRT